MTIEQKLRALAAELNATKHHIYGDAADRITRILDEAARESEAAVHWLKALIANMPGVSLVDNDRAQNLINSLAAATGALPHVGPAPSPLRDAAERVVIVPEGQTPLDKNLRHPLLDAFNSGIASRENGSSSPYHGHSVEHCLRAAGWVQKDLRLALDKARADLRAALANEQPKGGDVLGTGEIEPALTAPVDFEPSAEAVKTALRVWWDDDDIIDDPAEANFIIKSLSEMKDALCAALKIDGPRLIAEAESRGEAREREAATKIVKAECTACGGEGWLCAHELGIGQTTDDTKYSCNGRGDSDACRAAAAIRERGETRERLTAEQKETK